MNRGDLTGEAAATALAFPNRRQGEENTVSSIQGDVLQANLVPLKRL
ncbi:hypothetical protein [Brevibacillus porteri]|nr:hypothetical protein [Brevibacillus porteri]MED2132958.1 hypothetical protein [Brevibacillus porteri]MED2894405.1 hypothetical protein [Brevibacillus porteri]